MNLATLLNEISIFKSQIHIWKDNSTNTYETLSRLQVMIGVQIDCKIA
jgi:hypothetical protein